MASQASQQETATPTKPTVSGLRRFKQSFARVFSASQAERPLRQRLQISSPSDPVHTSLPLQQEKQQACRGSGLADHPANRSSAPPEYSTQTCREDLNGPTSHSQPWTSRPHHVSGATALNSNPVPGGQATSRSNNCPAPTSHRHTRRSSKAFVASSAAKHRVSTLTRSHANYQTRACPSQAPHRTGANQIHASHRRQTSSLRNRSVSDVALYCSPSSAPYSSDTTPSASYSGDSAPSSNLSLTSGAPCGLPLQALSPVVYSPFRLTPEDVDAGLAVLAENQKTELRTRDLEASIRHLANCRIQNLERAVLQLATRTHAIESWQSEAEGKIRSLDFPRSPHSADSFRPLLETLDEAQNRIKAARKRRKQEQDAKEAAYRAQYDRVRAHLVTSPTSDDTPAPLHIRPKQPPTATRRTSALRPGSQPPAAAPTTPPRNIARNPSPNPSFSPPDISALPGAQLALDSAPRPATAAKCASSHPLAAHTAPVRAAKATEITIPHKKEGGVGDTGAVPATRGARHSAFPPSAVGRDGGAFGGPLRRREEQGDEERSCSG